MLTRSDAAADIVDRPGLNTLIALMQSDGYRVIGPQAVDGAIV